MVEAALQPEVAPPALSGTRFLLAPMGGSLGQAEVDLADLVERTRDAVILIDTGDVIRYWNRGAEEMFQYARAEVVGRRIGFLVPSDLQAAAELDWIARRIQAEGCLCNFLTRRVRKDGVERWVSLTRSVLHDTAGAVIGSSAVFRDVTEERRAHEELSRAQGLAMVGEMSITMAHEIKNRLAAIQSAIQILDRRRTAGDPSAPVFAEVLQEVRRLDETARDLLRYARPGPLRPVPTELSGFVGAVVAALELVEEVRRHRVEIAVPAGLVAHADAELLGQALQNLVLNAAQATSRPGEIRISARRDGEWVEIEVADAGCGIPEQTMPAIFQPFFTTKTRGTGLGLCIARKSVEAHGGRIEVESRAGEGSRFTIRLPDNAR